jgi:hypothetical protein
VKILPTEDECSVRLKRNGAIEVSSSDAVVRAGGAERGGDRERSSQSVQRNPLDGIEPTSADRLGAAVLVLFAGCGILYATIGCLLLWSRDVRAYLDEDKFPLPPGADRENEHF